MKQLKKHYKVSLALGIIAALAVVVFLAIGLVGGPFIPWTVAVKGTSSYFGFLNISYRYLVNLFFCFGKGGWAWDFTRIAIPAIFWADVLVLIIGIILAARKGDKKYIAPMIFIALSVAGILWTVEGVIYCKSLDAMRLRYAFSFGVCLGGFISSIALCFLAMFSAFELKNVEANEENNEKIAALEAKVAELEAKAIVAPAAANEPVVAEEGKGGLNIQRIPFEVKLANAEKDIKDKYAELAAYITDTYGIKARQSIAGVSFSAHREKLVFVTIIGKHLRTNYALDAKNYADSSLPVTMSENKKYEDTPLTLKVKSDLSLRRAKGLVDDVMALKGIEKIAK